jgi:hypothetical protein
MWIAAKTLTKDPRKDLRKDIRKDVIPGLPASVFGKKFA